MNMNDESERIELRASRGPLKPALYRQARAWHGYLSALAFIALMFFSITGVFLNHPEWFANAEPARSERSMILSPEVLAQAKAAPDMDRTLISVIKLQAPLSGELIDSYVEDETVNIRLQGVRGTSSIAVNLASGATTVTTEDLGSVAFLNELHRGTRSGPFWRAAIDFFGVLFAILSVLGYILFFSLRHRLRTSIALTAVSLAAMVLIITLLVT